ncbi:hypothetical protein EXU57_22610 [Segetibacter sp. 3557_3]|uniref:hypothetical protein n=1 Tax=Segetibacter sp. 3557_3 TaxID=2547429 RepID=UPI001058ED66|nr:hypothetical protein [Segetibacter sp. 3557_3]TDH19701.1 hypothetical protein EXU57_22610 [Segetibacter sp. 3557_3]
MDADKTRKPEPPADNALVIVKQNGESLSKEQQNFNRLIRKIDVLRTELAKVKKDLSDGLTFYATYIHPLEQQLLEMQKEAVRLLVPFTRYTKSLSRHEKGMLKDFLIDQLDQIQLFEEKLDPELGQIFYELNGFTDDDALQLKFERVKSEIRSMFHRMGYDVDLQKLHKDMSEEELIATVREIQENVEQSAGEHRRTKANEAHTQQKRKASLLNQLRTTNLSAMYKQLAKMLHPDLEQDEDRKVEKETLMKQLTTAYNNNDLHTMLSLEITWMETAKKQNPSASHQKIKLYNRALREQVKELENELYQVKQHPRYHPVMRYEHTNGFGINLKATKRALESKLGGMRASVKQLQGKQAMLEVKAILLELLST